MSPLRISLSPDLKKLRDEGYEISIVSAHLVVSHVPYVNANREVRYGKLISDLTLANDRTVKPGTHVVHFAGDHPCHRDGGIITQISHASQRRDLAPGLTIDHSFSNKPQGGYPDYYAKMTRYIEIISAPAKSIDNSATAQTFPVHAPEEDNSPFHYLDTATSRAEIGVVSAKLENQKIAIVGLGGTGAYVLDFVSKTPVREIHIFDGDVFSQHNAFRAPGAASKDDLDKKSTKVEYLRAIYSRMHRGIIAHPEFMGADNVNALQEMDFAFLCLDKGPVKRLLVDALNQQEKPFIDVGMGLQLSGDSLHGILRVVTSTPLKRDHVGKRISFGDGDENNEYDRNIQVADLNALNAALAVVRWKKHLGFYADLDREHSCLYTIDGNAMLNEDA